MRDRLVYMGSTFRTVGIDPDEMGIITYDGLESCILNSQSYVNTNTISGKSGYSIKSSEEEETSFSGAYVTRFSDVEAMKETFSKLLLGEDITGGCKGKTSAVAISNAITNLAASVFGELWKLQPLSEEVKAKWIKEMNWLLSPTNYMVELVPAKQSGTNGSTFKIMMPKARADIHVNIPALLKIDSMLIEVLDSMVGTKFRYTVGNVRKESGGESVSVKSSKRWWFPYPRVPAGGISETARKKLIYQGNLVHQVFKAAKTINENVLLEMTVTKAICIFRPT
ncbi:hypothetical protein RND81_09G090300 [Saponaria officinalis]|uniref:PRONE domain-containing protein n=1 Tax=Saponaria officinalis TaxID=3572 RepID=A0AAW1IKM7_SAPOF